MRPDHARLLALYDCRIIGARINDPDFARLMRDGYAMIESAGGPFAIWRITIAGRRRAKEISHVREIVRPWSRGY